MNFVRRRQLPTKMLFIFEAQFLTKISFRLTSSSVDQLDGTDDFLDYFEDEGDLRGSMEFFVERQEEERSLPKLDFSITVAQAKQKKSKQKRQNKKKNKTNKNKNKNAAAAAAANEKSKLVVIEDVVLGQCQQLQQEEMSALQAQFSDRIETTIDSNSTAITIKALNRNDCNRMCCVCDMKFASIFSSHTDVCFF
jgi:hypothetical protein